MKTVLAIAGSDCSGGAGIEADLKTMLANGVFGMSVITAVTAQNTMGVQKIEEISPASVGAQIDSVFSDIRPDAVKIGMVASAPLICTIAERLTAYKAKNIVLDPVMIATSKGRLLQEDAVGTLIDKLLPMADIITPNLFEAAVLSGLEIHNKEEMEQAAQIIAEKTKMAVLVKGGHLEDRADDLLWYKGQPLWLTSPMVDNPNTHGTGCTLSSAIASYLARGLSLQEATKEAKTYVYGAIAAKLDLGHGRGPLDHGYRGIKR
ncbi:MAG: bifunctional hydroxymethylpyrimidine kinase/phosphomethylpyrimidine kinase [Spirochaetia bacterium]|jgi:hydroxymethylpyrimidine/phosphomethylpyrimidine kinase|nr:bifunctional hydroxymethylpyrimidine kinase/phosphomethylpyrimidine kinase [Spirochaetia bacterium]